jgi:branched-chain amino acid aminotransferase
MLDDRQVYLNGNFVPWQDVHVHVLSQSVSRGSLIFEFLSFHETPGGPAIFRLDEHVARLARTANLLNMELPLAPEELAEATRQTIKRNNLRKGFIKIMAYYPQIAFDIFPPQKELDVAIFAVDPEVDLGGVAMPSEEGASACVPRWRKLDPQTVPIEAKVSANYLNGLLARTSARQRGFEYAIMLDTQGFIAEGAAETVFFVKEGQLLTPTLSTVLDSITRKSLLEIARTEGVPAVEARLHQDLLEEAEEAFLACTPTRVLPLRQIEDKTMHPVPGPVTRRLSTQVKEILSGQDARFARWLFTVS